jgi:hypothetical protein
VLRSDWQTLRRGGVPLLLAADSGEPPGSRELARAALAVLQHPEHLAGREREALSAWVWAWLHGWPTSFAREFGMDQERVLAWAGATASDPNRYLKLRRIAMSRLAAVL